MTEILLFHHACGLTPGVVALADRLRAAGHTVHTPDLYDGATFATIEEGVEHARSIGFDSILQRGLGAADGLPASLVYAGISLGVMPAQCLAQTRPGARGAVLLESCVPPAEFGGSWPAGVPVQVHGMDADPWFADGGDLDAARELAASTPQAQLFTYPGDRHLFTDSSRERSEADEAAADLLLQRVTAFLATLD